MLRRGGRMSPSTRRALLITPVWAFCTFWMWTWWINPVRVNYAPIYIPLTVALLYEFAILPTVFLYFVLRAKRPPRRIAPKGLKVAVITLCVPSKESLDIIERQLKAMAEIDYPHDSWILDEGNSKDVKRLAKQYGVKHFSRKGIKKYNQQLPPFKAKTKAGNVNAWLEHVKRRKYEFFVQFDIDHIAKPSYLNKTLGYFRDKQVAWVQSPSVYKNLSHWTARGAAEQELVLQGPLQMGFYGHSQTPFIIGSHCTYRMDAIREIGGFQPTRAEDHLDTVVLASKGYRGVFLPEIIAEGDGPETLTTYLAQQFAWAYSMFQVLLLHTPTLLKTMSFRRKWQFLFAQTWYPVWALAYFTMFLAPIVALLSNHDVARMNGNDFLIHFVPMFVCSFLVWWAARPIMKPSHVRLSWRGMILHAVRWPIVLRAVLAAGFKRKKPYMITPKGSFANLVPTVKLYRPFLALGITSSLAIITASLLHGAATSEGQTIFALTNAIFMLIICFVDLDLSFRKATGKLSNFRLYWLKPALAIMLLGVLINISLAVSPLLSNQVYAILGPPASTTLTESSIKPTRASTAHMSTEQLIGKIAQLPPSPNSKVPTIGMYDPAHSLHASRPYIQHSFIDWKDSHGLAQQILLAESSNNTPLITLQPGGEPDGNKLLSDIVACNYDQRLKDISRILAASHRPVYIRFAHEMELYQLYPWGNQDPSLFIDAWRHVVTYTRENGAVNTKWVWAPAGNPGAEAYYPGDEYVDVIGTTLLYDRYWLGDHHPSFYELESGRAWLQKFGKPVWIVEFGAGNYDPGFQQQLIREALGEYSKDGYKAIIYLNIVDSNIVGPDYRLHGFTAFGDLFAPPKHEVGIKPERLPKSKASPSKPYFNPLGKPYRKTSSSVLSIISR
jgi:cellulose synthase (UDP-forming)